MNTWAWQEPKEQARTCIKTTKVSAYIYEGLGLWQCVARGLTSYILHVTFMAIVLMIDSVCTHTISLCLSVTLSIREYCPRDLKIHQCTQREPHSEIIGLLQSCKCSLHTFSSDSQPIATTVNDCHYLSMYMGLRVQADSAFQDYSADAVSVLCDS